MDNDGYRLAEGASRPERFSVLSRGMRAGILSVELALVGLIAALLANFTLNMLAVEPQQLPPPPPSQRSASVIDASHLLSFDPFFRDVVESETQALAVMPESTLNIQVFGLRAGADGSGSAIIKLQDGEQKLMQVGDRITSGVKLAAVYADRLELLRAGVKEAVYLRPQQERAVAEAKPGRSSSSTRASGTKAQLKPLFSSLQLTPVRRGRRIIGFRLPEPTPLALLGTGLEGGDILTSVNGSPLSSFERLQETSEALSLSSRLLLEIERRGQKIELTVNLEGNS